MTFGMIPLLVCSLVLSPCGNVFFRRFKWWRNRHTIKFPDPFLSRPFDVSYLVLKQVDFFALSRLLRREYWDHPLTDAVRPVLKGRLIPGSRKIDWFNTVDAAHVFQDALKIRRFFEVMRHLYPEFDTACTAFRTGDKARVSPQMWRFLSALNDKARESLSYFFAADPAQHEAILHSDMHTVNSFSQLEEAMHRTIWERYDSSNVDRVRDFGVENAAATEIYVVFPLKVNPRYREEICSKIDWKAIKKNGYLKILHVDMPEGYSRVISPFVDPLASVDEVVGLQAIEILLYMRGVSAVPSKWFVEGDLQGFLPEGIPMQLLEMLQFQLP